MLRNIEPNLMFGEGSQATSLARAQITHDEEFPPFALEVSTNIQRRIFFAGEIFLFYSFIFSAKFKFLNFLALWTCFRKKWINEWESQKFFASEKIS